MKLESDIAFASQPYSSYAGGVRSVNPVYLARSHAKCRRNAVNRTDSWFEHNRLLAKTCRCRPHSSRSDIS